MNRTARAKMSPLFLALAFVSLALASFGYFELFTNYGDMPTWLAFVSVGGLDIAAVATGKHALTVAEDGDSAAPWNALLLLLTLLGAFAQVAYSVLAGHPLAVGIVSAAFPIVTVTLFEGQLRRVFRLNGRAAGRVAEPRATVDLLTWLLYRKLAFRATKLAVLDRGLDTGAALTIAERQLAIEVAAAERPAARRTIRRTYAAELSDGSIVDLSVEQPAIEATPVVHLPAQSADKPADPTDPADNEPIPADDPALPADDETDPADISDLRRATAVRGALTAAVNEAVRLVGNDVDLVHGVVRIAFPDVPRESVRRTLSRTSAG